MNNSDKMVEFIGEEKMRAFCPLIYTCPRQSMDSNCFYEKFLHCKVVEECGLSSKLSEEDLANRNKFNSLGE